MWRDFSSLHFLNAVLISFRKYTLTKCSDLPLTQIKHQKLVLIHKIRDPTSNRLIYESDVIHKIFQNYYETLYSQPKTVDEENIRQYLSTLDLPSVGKFQNDK